MVLRARYDIRGLRHAAERGRVSIWSFGPDMIFRDSIMPLNEAESVQGHIGILLHELDLIEEQLNAKELKRHEARSLSSQIEHSMRSLVPLLNDK